MQQLNSTVQKALAGLSINKTDLSRRLGKADNYIQMMLKGCTTKKQNELITMIEQVIAGEVFKSDGEIIKELSEKLEHSQNVARYARNRYCEYLNQNQKQKSEIEELTQMHSRYVSASETHNHIVKRNHTDEIQRLTQKHTDSMMQCSRTIEARQILLNSAEENTLYWISKVPDTRWQAFKLFIKLLITGKN